MKNKIHFVWQGVSNPEIRNHWKDGLFQAMKYLEEQYDVEYNEPWDEINDGIILYWEAPCTVNGQNAQHYNKIHNSSLKKILLFAGGPLNREWVKNFDLLCVESKINAKECQEQGILYRIAFGINDTIFYSQVLQKIYDGIHHGTCASWKRQGLLGEALKETGIVVGREQETDSEPFKICERNGTTILPEQSYEKVRELINQSFTLVQTCDYWGGGQRATLEAMACGIPVICMTDSPKNREYVEESGFGEVVEPNKEEIRKSVDRLKEKNLNPNIGIQYVQSKWTARHYYESLKSAIEYVNKN